MHNEATCLRCGYLLTDLEGVARCPECGLEIDPSLSGGELRRSDPLWVWTLAAAMTTGVAEVAGNMAVSLFHLARDHWQIVWGLTLIHGLDGALCACGWVAAMLLSSRATDAVPMEGPLGLRRALRIFATLNVIAQFARFGSNALPHDAGTALRWCTAFTSLASVSLFFLYLRKLGRRIPDAFVIRHSIVVMAFQIAAIAMLNWAPLIMELLSRAKVTRTPYDSQLGHIIWWAASVYALALLWHTRKRFLSAAIDARENWRAAG